MSGRFSSSKNRLGIRLLTIFLLGLSIAMAIISPLVSAGVKAGNATYPFNSKRTSIISPAVTPTGSIFDHVVIIVDENEGIYDICHNSPPPCFGNQTGAPFLGSLANNYTVGAQYVALISTSQPNYVALLSGSMQGCTASGCPSPITAPNLVDRFENAGLTWKGYFENMTTGTGCAAAMNSPEPYANIHNPFIVFQDIQNNTARCNKMVNVNPPSCGNTIDCVLVNDLNNATSPAPNFMWLTPNDCDNMRGNAVCNTGSLIGPGDKYLSKLVPMILNSRTFKNSRSALFITFDEGNSFCPGPFPSSENCVPAIWAGPVTKTKFGSGTFYNHYSFTKTIETNWNLATLAAGDAGATPMTEFFKSQPADYTISANPTSLAPAVGSKANSTISLTSINNFNGTVTLTATSNPTGPILTLNPTSITLTAQNTQTSTLTFSTSTIGNYTVTIKATSTTLNHNTTITASVAPPDFTITTNPSSLVFGQLTSTPGPTNTITPTGDRFYFETSYLRTSFQAQGLIWLFYEDTRFTCEHRGGCLMYTTSTNGTRWTTPTTVPVHITDNDFSVDTNGTSVFYVRYNETSYDSTCGQKMQFGLGRLSSTGTIGWQPEQTVLIGAANRAYPDDMITIDSNGQAWIGYMIDNNSGCGGNGTQRPVIIHSTGTNYAIWTGNMTICTLSCHSLNEHITIAALPNGQVYSLYWTSTFGIHGRLYNGTGWNAEETISAHSTDTNNWLFTNGPNVYAIYFDNITETYNFATRTTTGAWTINTIGAAETHTGTKAFSPSYNSLPDAASYDIKDNLFVVFYMNSSTQMIDQWAGSSSSWSKTTGWATTGPVPYPDSISSFIQTTTNPIGQLYYISGSTTSTINTITIKFTPAGNTGTFQATITAKNGFINDVNLSTVITPTTGLTVSCSPTTIPGGSGSSACNLAATTSGNYTVTVTATNGTLTHTSSVTVRVLSFPTFTISISPTSPVLVTQQSTPTITITALNGFTAKVNLSISVTTGLACGSIRPNNVTGSGTATVTCNATSVGNYTLTVTGTSGSLTDTTSVVLAYQDFSLTAPTQVTALVTSMDAFNVTAISLNHYRGQITFTDSVPNGLNCTPITPSNVNGSGAVSISCGSSTPASYTLIINGAAGSLIRRVSVLVSVQTSAVGGIVLPVDKLTLVAEIIPVIVVLSTISIAIVGTRRLVFLRVQRAASRLFHRLTKENR